MKDMDRTRDFFFGVIHNQAVNIVSVVTLSSSPIMLLIHLLMSDIRNPTFLCENTLKANGEGGDKRVTRDSLNNIPFALL